VLIDANGQLGTMSSSRRYKEDIQDMGDASSGLMSLRPVTFRYKQPYANGSKPIDYGLIAEEVADVYPDLVAYSPSGDVQTHGSGVSASEPPVVSSRIEFAGPDGGRI